MNREQFEAWWGMRRPAAIAVSATLMGLTADHPDVTTVVDRAFAGVWARRWIVEDADHLLRLLLVRHSRPVEVGLRPSDSPSNTWLLRGRAERARAAEGLRPWEGPPVHPCGVVEGGRLPRGLGSALGRRAVSRRTLAGAALVVPLAALGAWVLTSKGVVETETLMMIGSGFALRIRVGSPDRPTARLVRLPSESDRGVGLAAIPLLDDATAGTPTTGILPAGEPDLGSERVLVVHHPQLAWADLVDAEGPVSLSHDRPHRVAAGVYPRSTRTTPALVWGDLAGRVHGAAVDAWAVVPTRPDAVVYLAGSSLVVRLLSDEAAGLPQPVASEHLLGLRPTGSTLEVGLVAQRITLPDGWVVIAVTWSSAQGDASAVTLTWHLEGATAVMASTPNTRVWYLPEEPSSYPDLVLELGGRHATFVIEA
ncbi:hypothetical protein [Aestuariimicrobium sp. T2.26MG-19.2B]|uniref:hypothetical protein n=1 Tax=Aestuariimicrobium sp. T2.26MG-19.2B TaxID=3040679 RepID=UPI0024774307|nr:hypothetical protein [Aestuariimicrobium sp. T2.26MG-19.2B]CAI9408415.1 hypothetical protein AESSP_02026 [Aestuariimicrobium sp. T2.26MG-19.2B]